MLRAAKTKGAPGRLPSTVVALGLVSLFMDVSSEMIHALLPVFVLSTLGASASVFGIIEGVAEASVMLVKLVSGSLSDRLRRRKGLALVGYGLAALTKPLFALAGTVGVLFAARLLDRIGKGIRGAPRDALIADVTPQEHRGAAYGLRQSLDSVGALVGPLLAAALMTVEDDIREVYTWAIVPALCSVAVLWLGVREPPLPGPRAPRPSKSGRARIGGLGRRFFLVAAIGAVFTLARASEGFLILRAVELQAPVALAPLVLGGMNLVYALVSYPAGRLGDSVDKRRVLALAAVVLAVADWVLATATSLEVALLGVGLWGCHLGLSQGLLAALVAEAAPEDARGTAFGVFNFATGVSTLISSLLAGVLWDRGGGRLAFSAAATFAAIAAAGLIVTLRRRASA